MRKTAAAIVQHKEGWCGLTLTVREKTIEDVKVLAGFTFDEFNKLLTTDPVAIALDNAAGYLFNLSFPFRGHRKISLVIAGQLEEMLPFPVEEMLIDFQEIGEEGKVLAAAVPRATLAELTEKQRSHNVTLHSLAVLNALKWLRPVHPENLVFINCSGNTVVIMTFRDGAIVHLRQFHRSPQSTALIDALQHMMGEGDFDNASCIMVGDDDISAEKETIEHAIGVMVDNPVLDDYINGPSLPAWAWAGIGAALMALDPRDQINLSEERSRPFLGSNRRMLYAASGLAALSLVVLGLFSLDFYLKQRTYAYLSTEPNRIYRAAFPKSPPVRDVARTFEERIRSMDRDQGSSSDPAAHPLALLNEISAKIDPQIDVKLSEFTADDKEFALAGTTTSFASLEKIKAALEQVRGAEAIELQTVDMAGAGQVKFRFRGRL